MYSSFGQLVRGWSRILYDALGRKTWRLVLKLLDPIIFCQSGHLALAAALALLASGRGGSFAAWLLILALIHHGLMFLLFLRVYTFSVPGSRSDTLVPAGEPGRGRDPRPCHPDVLDRQSIVARYCLSKIKPRSTK